MSAFNECQKIEAKAMADLIPLIRDRSFQGQLVVTDKGNLSKELQKEFGDVLFNGKDDKKIWAVEIKAEEECRTGNLYLETWSNLSRFTPGWMINLRTDLLLYYFLSTRELYIIPFENLRRWSFRFRNIYRFPEKEQKKHDQLNDTWGRCVPISVLLNANIGMKRIDMGSGQIEPIAEFNGSLFAEAG